MQIMEHSSPVLLGLLESIESQVSPRPPALSTGARAKAWCLLIHAEASL